MRLAWPWAVALVLPAGAGAQLAPYRALAADLQRLRESGQIPSMATPNPLTPEGFPQLAPRDAALPTPQALSPRFQVIRGGTLFRRNGPYVHAEGGCEFLYEGYRIFADTVDGNLVTRQFELSGDVKMVGEDTVVQGARVTVDFPARTYRAFDGYAQISPKVIQGKLLDDLYVRGAESFGSRREITLIDGSATTCNLDSPHFELEAGSVVVRPGVRAIFRNARFQIFGRTILAVPFFSVPLDDRTYRNLPQVGYSQDEGYYIKSRFGIPLQTRDSLDVRLDYMSKLGIGYGADFTYRNRQAQGVARAYAITGETNTLTFSNQHRQKLGKLDVSFDNDFQRNNYLNAPSATIYNTRSAIVYPQGRNSSRLSFALNGSDSSSSSAQTRIISVNDQREYGAKTRSTIDIDWTTSNSRFSGSNTDREQVDVRARGSHELRKATAALEYQRSIPVGSTAEFFGGSDRTPVLSLTSDSRRLLGDRADRSLPFRTELSLGEFSDPVLQGRVTRASFDISMQRPDRSNRRLKADFSGAFKQGVYSDDTAQYVLGFGSNVSYRLGNNTSANLRYNYLRPYGYSPLTLDYAGQTNLVTADLSFRVSRPILFSAQSGYDILRLQSGNTAWQQVGLKAEYAPTRNFLLRALSTYDSFSEVWSNVRLDMSLRAGGMFVSFGARYDGVSGTWGNANLYLDNLRWGRSKLGLILSYNGYTKQFDATQISWIYDLHCAEAVLTLVDNRTGFRPGREIQFFLRLKALPFDSIFGTGRRGQPLGTGTGRDF